MVREVYRHYVRLAGKVQVFSLSDRHPERLLLKLEGNGETPGEGWFAPKEVYVFLANREVLLEISRVVLESVSKLRSSPHARSLGAQAQRTGGYRPFHHHLADPQYTRRSAQGDVLYSGPALILTVENQAPEFQVPFQEDGPYWFRSDQHQLSMVPGEAARLESQRTRA